MCYISLLVRIEDFYKNLSVQASNQICEVGSGLLEESVLLVQVLLHGTIVVSLVQTKGRGQRIEVTTDVNIKCE